MASLKVAERPRLCYHDKRRGRISPALRLESLDTACSSQSHDGWNKTAGGSSGRHDGGDDGSILVACRRHRRRHRWWKYVGRPRRNATR